MAMTINGMKIQRLDGSSRDCETAASGKGVSDCADQRENDEAGTCPMDEEGCAKSPQPQMTSARNGSVPPIPKAMFLMVGFKIKNQEGRFRGVER